jgi:hypothetical protein
VLFSSLEIIHLQILKIGGIIYTFTIYIWATVPVEHRCHLDDSYQWKSSDFLPCQYHHVAIHKDT